MGSYNDLPRHLIMQAFHNDPHIKEQAVEKLKAYFATKTLYASDLRLSDSLPHALEALWPSAKKYRGDYWFYESLLGIPATLAHVKQNIFSLLYPAGSAWAIQFLEAIPVGADLSSVWDHIALFLLTDPQYGIKNVLPSSSEAMKLTTKVAELYLEQPQEINRWKDIWKQTEIATAHYSSKLEFALSSATFVPFWAASVKARGNPYDAAGAGGAIELWNEAWRKLGKASNNCHLDILTGFILQLLQNAPTRSC